MTDEWTADEWNGSVCFCQSNNLPFSDHKSLVCMGRRDAKLTICVELIHRSV